MAPNSAKALKYSKNHLGLEYPSNLIKENGTIFLPNEKEASLMDCMLSS